MQRARASWLGALLVCGCAAGSLFACDEAAGDEGEVDPPPDGDGDPASPPGSGAPIDEGCLTRAPGAGFASLALSPSATLGVVDLEVTATTLGIDGTIGLAHGTATAAAHLATMVRFAPGGALQARDGAAFRADQSMSFAANRTYPVRFVTDLASRTYSVYVEDPDTGEVARLARRYAFRAGASGAPGLDALAAAAMGTSGQLTVCNVVGAPPSNVVYAREGSYTVAPLPGDQALVSDGVSTTWKLGPAGQVLRSFPRGGEVAADEAGNIYVAVASGGQLALHAFTAQLAPRWSRVDPVEPFADVSAMSADAGGVTIALASVFGVASIRRYPANGGAGGSIHSGGALAAVARDGFAIATSWEGGFAVLLYDLKGNLRWGRSFDAPATIEVLTLGLGGRVVVGGHFAGPLSLGGPTLQPAYDGGVDVNSYVLGLRRTDGTHAFTTRIPTTVLTDAAGNAGRLVVAGETWVTPVFPHLWQLDAAGHLLPGEPELGFYEQWGRSGRVAIGPSNRIYWERWMVWPKPYSPAFPYLLAIKP